MKVYGYAGTRSTRVVWALEEAGASYEYVNIDLRTGEARQPNYLAINVAGKVPAFEDGALRLTESAAICLYIADKFPATNLAPAAGSPERARLDQWCYFAMSELEQPLWTMAKHTFALPEKYRVPAIIETAKWELNRAAGVLAAGLADREYILGDLFSVADLLLANCLDWARRRSIQLEPAPLNAYADRMISRPALARAVEREKSALPSDSK
jgi:glutathione S-transferase